MRCFASNSVSLLSITLILLAAISAGAQNLVPNGGFENGTICPTGFANLQDECDDWYFSIIPDNFFQPTPDWYHVCSDNDLFSPPEIAYGSRETHEGEGYAGIGTYDISQSNIEYKEIMGVELTDNLIVGQSYLVDFWVASLIPSASFDLIFTNKIGFNFSTHGTYHIEGFPIDRSHFSVDTIIGSNAGWVNINVEFTADSTYNYLHIGNFYQDDSTETAFSSDEAQFSYYVIDNVSVSPLLNSISIESNRSNLELFPNPTSGILNIRVDSQSIIQRVEIYSTEGRKIHQQSSSGTSKVILKLDYLKSGAYHIKIKTPKTTHNETFFKI